ncbi:MAG: gliding motility-associated lipoprotein GldH [Bacteroidetes bacterium]|nr:MAG: gliding motility-associated lipoprotein GldH [Bacteroidota bacterium]
MKKVFPVLFLFSLLLFSACDENRLFEENRELPDHAWSEKNKLAFSFFVSDTVSPYNFYINLRNADDYPYSNCYVFMTTHFPNNKIRRDTIELMLADQNGRWLGKGQGDIYDNQLKFRSNMRFPLKGKYLVEMEQAMRRQSLPGMYNAGIRIEKSTSK